MNESLLARRDALHLDPTEMRNIGLPIRARHGAKLAAVIGAIVAISGLTVAASVAAQQPPGGKIGYVITERHWAIHQSEDGSEECPEGFNIGPREQYSALYPEDSGKQWSEAETRLVREGRRFHRDTSAEPFPFYEAGGRKAYGLNLDGRVDPEDFESPDGEPGIDNQLQRAIGCISIYRGPDGTLYHFSNLFMYGNAYNRWMIELENVDDLSNDDAVTVTFYRGLDDLVTDASGTGFVAGGTQRVDTRWGQSFIQTVKGKITDGVLLTEPAERAKFPWSFPGIGGGFHIFKDFQMELTLTPKTAQGTLAGFVDVEQFSHRLNRNWTTHHQSYGQLSAPSLYRAMRRLADGHPNESGENTAISGAVDIKLHQVYIVDQTVAASE